MCIQCLIDSQQEGVQLDYVTIVGTPEELNTVVEALEALDKVDEPESFVGGNWQTEPEDVEPDEPCGPDCTCFDVVGDPEAEVAVTFEGTDFSFYDLSAFETTIWNQAYLEGVTDGIATVEAIIEGAAAEETEQTNEVDALAEFLCSEIDDLEDRVNQIMEGLDARLDVQQLEITDLNERVASVEATATVIWGNQLIGGINLGAGHRH